MTSLEYHGRSSKRVWRLRASDASISSGAATPPAARRVGYEPMDYEEAEDRVTQSGTGVERHDGPTPNGGAYSRDDQRRLVPKELATELEIHEYTADGRLIRTTWGTVLREGWVRTNGWGLVTDAFSKADLHVDAALRWERRSGVSLKMHQPGGLSREYPNCSPTSLCELPAA
jgi:hypothetical protein